MNLPRRDFLKNIGASALAVSVNSSWMEAAQQRTTQDQKLHPDYQSNNPGTEYYFLGNGKIIAALQSSAHPDQGTHAGLLVMSSDHFARKLSTYLYHPERGVQNSRFVAIINGRGYVPEFASSTIRWEYPDSIPTIVLQWEAGGCRIREEFSCPIDDAAVVRTVMLENASSSPVDASSMILLYPNLMFFDEYHIDRTNMMLTATGYKTLRLFTLNEATVGERHMNIPFGRLMPGEKKTITIILTLDVPRDEFERKGLARMREESATYWKRHATFRADHDGLNHLFQTSKSGIRAAVARTGKMDGSIWQYNLEWVRDQSMVVVGSTVAGQTDIAESLLRRILTRSVDDDGKTVDASRHRPPETIELDQNGELLYALWTHWVWSGTDAIIQEYWPKISGVADYVLQPVFRDPSIGLLKNSREYWERDPAFGVKEGYELTYQAWNIVGLQRAADMARHMNEMEKARRWDAAAALMRKSFLEHPRFSLVEDGRFIKRRLVTGEVQRTFEPPHRAAMPQGMPLNVERVSYCDPDAGNVTPIMLDIVDPKSSVSLKTLESMEHLWNQRWSTGGYARYDVTSEPDSPGPWPFATLFITRAYFEAGNDEKVWRALKWLLDVQGGKSGAWFEYYGDRPSPPLPPVGIVVWTWAEFLVFFMHHLLGLRPNTKNLVIRPRFLKGMNELEAKAVVHGQDIQLRLKRAQQQPSARVDGKTIPLFNGAVTIPLPTRSVTIEMNI